jgi:hypothetical protein
MPVILEHSHACQLVVEPFADAAARFGERVIAGADRGEAASLLRCLASVPRCAHPRSAIVVALGANGTIAVRCGPCWGAHETDRCPTCLADQSTATFVAGLLTVCRRCGEALALDWSGKLRIVSEQDYSMLLAPEAQRFVDEARLRHMHAPAGSA